MNSQRSIFLLVLGLASFGAAKTNPVKFEVFRQQEMTEFAGGDTRAPLRDLSVNSILGYCAEVNKYFSPDPCDGPGYARVLKNPSSLILVPSENDRNAAFNLLLVVERSGGILFFDGDPAHRKSAEGFHFADIGKADLDFGYGTSPKGIVSDFKGGLWLADPGRRRILRLSHSWAGAHSFTIEGELLFDQSQLVDMYFTDMKTGSTGDDRLYVATRNPDKILVIDPYFVSQTLESQLRDVRDLNLSLQGMVVAPQAIYGAYNNEPASTMDVRDLYVVYEGQRLSLIRDYGVETALKTNSSIAANISSRFNGIRTNDKGELFIIDAGNSVIHKYASNLEFLYSTGRRKVEDGQPGLAFDDLRSMAMAGRDIYTAENYNDETGIRRFANAAAFLEYDFSGIGDLGYNPANAGTLDRPYPKVRFKVSEFADAELSIYRVDGAGLKVEIWNKDLGEVKSGWNEEEFDWDGKEGGVPVAQNVTFSVVATKFFADGDNSLTKEVVIDTRQPTVDGPGRIEFTAHPSAVRPFAITIPYTERVTGSFRILNSVGSEIDRIDLPGGMPEDFKTSLDMQWEIHGLGDCESFHVEVEARDYAGNSTGFVRIDGAGGLLPDVRFANASGGFQNLDFLISPRTISSVSTIPANRFTTIRSDATSVCAVPYYYNVKVYDNPAMTGTPVFTLGPDSGDDRLVETGPFAKDWQGRRDNGEVVPDGTYYSLITMESLAGYSTSSRDASAFENSIQVKTAVPKIALTGAAANRTIQVDSETYLFVSGNDKVEATVSFNPTVTPTEGKVVIDYVLLTTGGTTTTFRDEYPVGEMVAGRIALPKGDSRARLGGKYLFTAYFVDEVGNSGRAAQSTNVISQEGVSLGAFIIDNSQPSVLLDIEEHILSAPLDLKLTLFNNTSGFADGNAFRYSYDLTLKAPGGQVTILKSNAAMPPSSLRVNETVPANRLSANGTYEVSVVLKDNVGRQSEKASVFAYLNERPNVVGANLPGGAISGKTYITGALGDPFITTGGPEAGFDKYLLLYKTGSDQVPGTLDPAQLEADGWETTTGASVGQALFAPFYRQDAANSGFPFANASIVPTNLQGFATIGFLQAGTLPDGPYTLLALTYEKRNATPRAARTNFSVDNSTEPDAFKILRLETQSDAAGILIRYESSKSANLHFVVAKFEDGTGTYSKKVNEFHFSSVPGGTEQQFTWNFEDAFGNQVEDGSYRILALAEDLTSSAADWRETGSLLANTSIRVSQVAVSPSQIVVPPREVTATPDENVATVTFMANKHCSARLQVFFGGALVAETPAKAFLASGVSAPKVVTWDGSGEGALPYDPNTAYELKLLVASLDDPNDKAEIDGLFVKRISPAMADARPGLPSALLELQDPDLSYDAVQDHTTAGTSDVFWQTLKRGRALSGDPATASGQIGIGGRQNVTIWKSNAVDNRVHVRVRKKLRRLIDVNVSYSARVFFNNGTSVLENRTDGCLPATAPTDSYLTSFTYFLRNFPSQNPIPTRVEFTLNSVSSPLGANDLAPYVAVNFSATIGSATLPYNSGWNVLMRGHCVLDETQFAATVEKDLQSTGAAWPDHYHDMDLVEPAFPDFPVEFYNARAAIEYTYEVLDLPEEGSVEFPDFAFSPIDASPYLANQRMVGLGAKLGNYYPISFTNHGEDVWGTSDLILYTGSVLDRDTPVLAAAPRVTAMTSGQKYLLRANARCNAEGTVNMHWPFPASGVPATTVDGQNYSAVAFKTSPESDPRTDGTNFANILGPYRVDPSATLAANGQLLRPYALDLRPEATYPYSIAILPDIHQVPAGREPLPGSVNATLLAAGQDWPPDVTLTASGNNLQVTATLASMPRIDWSSDQDPFVLPYSPAGTIGYRETFSKDGLVLKSSPIDIPARYLSLTGMPMGTGDMGDVSAYRYSFWRNGAGSMIENAAQSDPDYRVLSGGRATLSYVDGSPNDDLEIDDFHVASNSFSLKHAPNATPRRFIEVLGSYSTSDGSDFDRVSLDYYSLESRSWNEFGPIRTALVDRLPDIHRGTGPNVLGYWDITHCNGPYILKLTAEKASGVKEVFQTIRIGTPVDVPANGPQVVYSPYSKAQVAFPSGSKHKGEVSIVPIAPSDIRGVNLERNKIIPLGPLLEISPSGLVFDKASLPKVTFSMTVEDVIAMGISPENLGELNIYYVDENRGELVALETGITRLITRAGSTVGETVDKGVLHAPLVAGDLFRIEGPIEHTSVYGSFPESVDDLRIQSPPALLRSTPLQALTGTVSGSGTVTVFVSQDADLDKTEPAFPAVVSGNAWSAGPLALNEGKNFLFAVSTIDGVERVVQTEVTLDRTAPVMTGTFQPQFVAFDAEVPYSFEVSSSEAGTILVREVGNPNALTSEYALTPVAGGGFRATIQILPNAFKDLRTIVELHAVDLAGNNSTKQYLEVVIDNGAPTFILTNTDIQAPITGTLKDIHAVDRVELMVSVQGTEVRRTATFAFGQPGDFSFSVDFSGLPEGEGTLSLVGYDKAQNTVTYGPQPIRIQKGQNLPSQAIAQYIFREEQGSVVADIAGIGIPLDLELSGSGVQRLPGGGITFPSVNHGSFAVGNRRNPKLFDRITRNNEMAAELWIRTDNLSQNSYQRIAEFGTPDGSNNWNFAVAQVGSNLVFKLRTQSAPWVELVTTTSPLSPAPASHHVVMTYAPFNPATGEGGMRVYVDKSQQAANQEKGLLSATGTNGWGVDYRLTLGNRPGATSGGWEGDVLMAAIYDRNLDSLGVKALFATGIPERSPYERVPLGVSSATRILPTRIVQGIQAWKEDAKSDGGGLSMEGIAYRTGLAGSPSGTGGLSWLVYDLESQVSRLGLDGSALRLAGFLGRQDGAGSVNVLAKTSSSVAAPMDDEWRNETGAVQLRTRAANVQNASLDIDLQGARWLMLGMDSESPDNADLGVAGSAELIVGHRPAISRNGLRYSYYEGTWDFLPNFSNLPAVKIGEVDGFSLSPRLRSDNFGFRFEGYIAIATQGLFTFYTNSDDGSRLYVDETLVVDNDGTHGLRENFGSVFLTPGYHRIAVTYFDKTGGEGLSVRYSGPDVPKQSIPAGVLFKDSPETPELEGGITYRYFEGTWSVLPDFSKLVPITTGFVSNFDIGKRLREDAFGFQFEGWVSILDAGLYSFHLNSDDGSKLYIDDLLVVSNDGNHAPRVRSGSIQLSAGPHRIKVEYYECQGGQALEVSYEGPGVSKRLIPSGLLSRSVERPTFEMPIHLNTTASGANVPNTVTGFPLLVRLDASNFNFSSAQPDGSDIRFRAADGRSLPFEIELWDREYKQAAIWVKTEVPGNKVSTLYLVWGNSLAAGGSRGADVFADDKGFEGVWHLGEPGNSNGGGYRDASGNSIHGTGVNTGNGSAVLGVVGFGQTFNGQNQYIRLPQTAAGPLNFPEDGNYTVSAWVRSDVLDGRFHNAISKGDNQYGLMLNASNAWEFVESNSGSWEVTTQAGAKARWVHVAGVRSGVYQSLYVNGVMVDNGISAIPGSSRNTGFEVNIGRNSQNTSTFFAGQIDEVRLSSVARSADWIRLNYENQKPHQTLVTVDPEDYGEWQHTKALYLNTTTAGANVMGTVENFPVLVRLRAGDFDFQQAQDAGQDVRFSTSSGTHLEYEIEKWDVAAQAADIWVLVPRILGNNASQFIRMNWGNPWVEDRSSPQNVFQSGDNFVSVWHLAEDPTGEGQKKNLDATSYGNHATSQGNMGTSNQIEGKVGKALQLNGIGNHLHHEINLNKPEGTVSAWMRPDQVRNMVGFYESDGAETRYNGFGTGSADLETDLGIYNGEWSFTYQDGPTVRKGGGTPQVGRWDHVVFRWDRTGSARLYVNGQSKTVADLTATAFSSKPASVFSIGEVGVATLDRYWKGALDEMRILNQDVSEDWIRLNYENQKDGQSLVQPLINPPSPTYVRFRNRWLGTYLHTENRTGSVQNGSINLSWESAQWIIEDSGLGYVRFKNRWTGEYMHIENLTGSVQHGSINSQLASAKWLIDEFNGYKRIRNLWNGHFIHIENNTGRAQHGTVYDTWASAQWTIEAVPTSGKEGAIVMEGENADRNYLIAGAQWFKIPLAQYANTWAQTVVVALDDMDGRVMEGQFQFENGVAQSLNTWFQSFSTPYTRQGEVYFTITVPADRRYKVRWWYQ